MHQINRTHKRSTTNEFGEDQNKRQAPRPIFLGVFANGKTRETAEETGRETPKKGPAARNEDQEKSS